MKNKLKLSYTRIIALGFLSLVLVGSLLLSLPVATRDGSIKYTDALFTSTSAACVTGLSVFDIHQKFSLFGQLVILLLIQIGGIGFMSIITMFSVFMKKNIGLRGRKLLMQASGGLNLSNTGDLIRSVLLVTLSVEGIGTILLSFRFCPILGDLKGIYYAIFHSVSAYCNAGFDLMSAVGSSSFTCFADDPFVLLVISFLVIAGGFGFLAISDIAECRCNFKKFRLHTKIVFTATLILVFGGMALIFVADYNGAFAGMKIGDKLVNSFFQSVITRTAGFYSVPQTSLSDAGSIVSSILMFIGGSPGSTAGGVKTTTVAVLLITTLSTAKNEDSTVAFKKKINHRLIRQSSAIIMIYFTVILIAVPTICAIENAGIRESGYEVISAAATVGLSMGITSGLKTVSKIIIIVLMYAGRIGGLSFVTAFAEKHKKTVLERPEEEILIG